MLRTMICAALAAMLLAVPLASAEDETTEAAPDESQNPRVLMKTSKGDITIELFEADAPISVANFLKYVDADYFDGTIFHRIVPGFVIQGGGFTPDMTRKETNPPIKNEATNGLKNLRGTLSMARTSVVDSATSQFFINTNDNGALDHRGTSARTYGYAVFGRVVDGMDVVDAIEKVQTGIAGGMRDVPIEPVVIESVSRL